MSGSGLFSPTMVVMNKQGEVILALKRKGENGILFYVFELRLDRCDPEDLQRVQLVWELTKRVAASLGIPLYDSEEIFSKVKAELEKPDFKEGDVTIEVLDHATGRIGKLVVGITKAPKP